jgi:hypothetical protein
VITEEGYNKLADLFEEARYGNGPGISKFDLEEAGLKVPETFKAKCGRRLKVFGEWSYTCAFVYERLSGEEFKGSSLRGRGFRSQENGEIVVKLLRRLASEQVAPNATSS